MAVNSSDIYNVSCHSFLYICMLLKDVGAAPSKILKAIAHQNVPPTRTHVLLLVASLDIYEVTGMLCSQENGPFLYGRLRHYLWEADCRCRAFPLSTFPDAAGQRSQPLWPTLVLPRHALNTSLQVLHLDLISILSPQSASSRELDRRL